MPVTKINEKRDGCRALQDSFHVGYTVNDEGGETEGLTHARIIDTEKIEERGDSECGWVAQIEDGKVELLVSTDSEMGWDIHHKLTPATCAQLGDMFYKAAVLARQQEAAQMRAEAEKLQHEIEEMKRQQALPFTGTSLEPVAGNV
ncbi:MAG TPA: hypothetical protein VJS44_08215 [Pyrinomonadaceae bacterium]|nr:hypothetical protein [Pyrinomonadaceae bacterium]